MLHIWYHVFFEASINHKIKIAQLCFCVMFSHQMLFIYDGNVPIYCIPLANVWPDWWSATEMVVLLEDSPISTEELQSSVRVTIGFLVTSLTKALLPRLLSLAGRPALGRFLVVPNFFHLRIMEATVFLRTFNTADIFWYPSPDLCLYTICKHLEKTVFTSSLWAIVCRVEGKNN